MNSCNFIGRLANDPRTRRDKVGDEILVTTYFNLVVERAFSQSKQKLVLFLLLFHPK